jgi:CTP synthase (UTP-ammonia lyase)
MVHIVVVGDYDPAGPTHPATTEALAHSAKALGIHADVTWWATDEVGDAAVTLAPFDGVLVAPGSPYRSLDGALAAITHARRSELPLLGTCGGMQHLVLEYARNVAGIAGAAHAEYSPDAAPDALFVTPLSCSLAGQVMEVTLRPGTRAAEAYGTLAATERYFCNFGLNPARVGDLEAAGLVVAGTDALGEVRVVEVPGLPFTVGTLFVPQASSTVERPHPLVTALVAAAEARAGRR